MMEVNKLIADAEKCMKTSFFNRTPDFDGAIENYSKAAIKLRNSQMLKEAAEMYKKVAELNFKNRSYFHCAKHYETAAQIHGELKEYENMASLISEAGQMLREYGTPDSASYVYERAAKSLEDHLPKIAAEFYEKSSEACKLEGKFHQAAAQVNNAARIMLSLKQFKEVERLLRLYMVYVTKANPTTNTDSLSGLSNSSIAAKLSGRAITAIIIMKLYNEDEVAASNVFNEGVQKWGYTEAEEFPAVRRLLAAVEDMDKEACLEAVKDQKFRLLDVHYARLLKEVKFNFSEFADTTSTPNNKVSNSSSAVAQFSNRAGDGQRQEEGEADEEEEDIC